MPSKYHVMFTIWFAVMLNVRIAPTISPTGDGGAKTVMVSGTGPDVSVRNLVSVWFTIPVAFCTNAL